MISGEGNFSDCHNTQNDLDENSEETLAALSGISKHILNECYIIKDNVAKIFMTLLVLWTQTMDKLSCLSSLSFLTLALSSSIPHPCSPVAFSSSLCMYLDLMWTTRQTSSLPWIVV